MRSSIPGTVIGLILVVCMLIISPLYYVGIIEWAKSESEIMSDTSNLIDKVIDTRVLTDDMLADYNISVAAKAIKYRTVITRETKVVNPDPLNPGNTYTTYVLVDDTSIWKQGDIITITVEPISDSIYNRVSRSMLGLSVDSDGFTLSGRVR